jgi:hypothetical protein
MFITASFCFVYFVSPMDMVQDIWGIEETKEEHEAAGKASSRIIGSNSSSKSQEHQVPNTAPTT